MNKFVKIGIFALIIILAGVFYWRYYFVFSEGVKGGTLNYFEKKGYVFKTWEGRIVQEGFQSPTAGALQSNEFRFSVQNDALVEQLERAGGKFVELRNHPFTCCTNALFRISNRTHGMACTKTHHFQNVRFE